MNLRPNAVKTKLADGESAVGIWAQIASPDVVEMMGHTGYDFVIIDTEHGTFHFETAVHLFRAADAACITPVIRVPDKNPSFIMRMLDAGAKGVLIPAVDCRAEAEMVVAAARYAPTGNRGACPGTRATGHQVDSWTDYVQWADNNIMVWLLIESLEGIDNFDEIIAVPGIDGIMLGPFDLAQAMGYAGQTRHPQVVEKFKGVIKKTLDKNIDIIVALFGKTADEIRPELKSWQDMGCRIFMAGSDKRIAMTAFKSALGNIRAVL